MIHTMVAELNICVQLTSLVKNDVLISQYAVEMVPSLAGRNMVKIECFGNDKITIHKVDQLLLYRVGYAINKLQSGFFITDLIMPVY